MIDADGIRDKDKSHAMWTSDWKDLCCHNVGLSTLKIKSKELTHYFWCDTFYDVNMTSEQEKGQ